MTDLHSAGIVAIAAAVTIVLRFLPFWVFRKSQSVPPLVTRLGQLLPHAIMGMLVVYCLKSVSFIRAPYGLPEAIACLVVALVHIWKRSTLLSIGLGTACYMFLVQAIF